MLGWFDLRSVFGRAMRDVRDRLHMRQIVWSTLPGTRLKVRGGNWMAAGVQHESFELDEFRSCLPDVDAVIDVGANSGIFSLLSAEAGKLVYAFEPLAENLNVFFGNLAANGLDGVVEVFPIAASDRTGVAKFYGRGQGASLIEGWAGQPEYDFVMSPTNTLDRLLSARLEGQRVALKIDVEGAEFFVLQGATKILKQCRFVLLEHSLTKNQPGVVNPWFKALFDLMWGAGFEARVADASRLLVTPELLASWISSGSNNLATENFIFRPSE